MKHLQKENSVREFSSISLSHPPLFLNKNTYKKIKAICTENQIDIETFTVELLRLALNRHEKEIQEIIKKVKK
jgi:hypothetical protein